MRRFILGLLLGLIALPVAAWGWLRFGNPPVAVRDPRLPAEQQIVQVPLNARIDREMPAKSSLDPSPVNLLLGAHVYQSECATCHGGYGYNSSLATAMFPEPPQLWAPHGHGIVGVSDDPAGETYWKVKNGIRLSGMPSYIGILNDTQMWQVTALLANADKPLPAEVLAVLKQPLPAGVQAPSLPVSGPAVIQVQPLPKD